jgi:hypothetical protein
MDLVRISGGGVDPTSTSGSEHRQLRVHGSSHKRVEPVTRVGDQGRVAFLSTSEQIRSPEQAPSTRMQGQRKDGHKGGFTHERADPVTRASHE